MPPRGTSEQNHPACGAHYLHVCGRLAFLGRETSLLEQVSRHHHEHHLHSTLLNLDTCSLRLPLQVRCSYMRLHCSCNNCAKAALCECPVGSCCRMRCIAASSLTFWVLFAGKRPCTELVLFDGEPTAKRKAERSKSMSLSSTPSRDEDVRLDAPALEEARMFMAACCLGSNTPTTEEILAWR